MILGQSWRSGWKSLWQKGIATANLGRVVLSKEAWRTSKHTIIASLRI